ncbi:9090_t:CDS:2 [Ambispora leptoticha]|uniref:9090_t:CDS:1 n=1 Tax=Ambispora leptoticha TaxID=144679 RepID=A0A9N8W778_9GLOM|nr:9090_t:CDS:2 [Ambispora leptoticha]
MCDWFWIISETGYVLDVYCAGTTSGTAVVLFTLNNQLHPNNQLWKLDGEYLVSKQTGYVLSLNTCPINDPTLVIKPKDINDKGQRWYYNPDLLTFTSGLPYYVLTAKSNTISDPKALGLTHWIDQTARNQKWTFAKCTGYDKEGG